MKKVIYFSRMGVLVAVVAILASSTSFAADCPDVATDGSLRVMTINLLFSEVQDRNERLEHIAKYAAGQSVDVILLQEVVAGALAGTVNAAVDLKQLLAARGVNYNLSYRLANGIPGLLAVGNAVLSRCRILYTVAKTLPFVTEEPFEGFEIPLRRRAMMSRIWVPGFGKVNVYNTHLCAFCSPEDRYQQAAVLYDFIQNVEFFVPGKNPIILGGDFNTEPDSDLYYAITDIAGFRDSFDEDIGGDCIPNPPEADKSGCTYASPGNPYVKLFETPVRIDYIFYKDWPSDPDPAEVVFNTVDNIWVSDHSAAVTDFMIPNQ